MMKRDCYYCHEPFEAPLVGDALELADGGKLYDWMYETACQSKPCQEQEQHDCDQFDIARKENYESHE